MFHAICVNRHPDLESLHNEYHFILLFIKNLSDIVKNKFINYNIFKIKIYFTVLKSLII